jgi:hypothetical protein
VRERERERVREREREMERNILGERGSKGESETENEIIL